MTPKPKQEYYLKGVYPVEVISEPKNGLVKVRVKTLFLHTSAYTEKKNTNHPRVGEAKKCWVRPGEVIEVYSRTLWKNKRRMAKGQH